MDLWSSPGDCMREMSVSSAAQCPPVNAHRAEGVRDELILSHY